MTENDVGTVVVDAAIRIHSDMGPGLLEAVYEVLLAHRLTDAGLRVSRQVPIGIDCGDVVIRHAFRADMIVQGSVLVELKCVEKVHAAHRKQLLTYLRLSGLRLGYLLNFGEALMKSGITRVVNNLPE